MLSRRRVRGQFKKTLRSVSTRINGALLPATTLLANCCGQYDRHSINRASELLVLTDNRSCFDMRAI